HQVIAWRSPSNTCWPDARTPSTRARSRATDGFSAMTSSTRRAYEVPLSSSGAQLRGEIGAEPELHRGARVGVGLEVAAQRIDRPAHDAQRARRDDVRSRRLAGEVAELADERAVRELDRAVGELDARFAIDDDREVHERLAAADHAGA